MKYTVFVFSITMFVCFTFKDFSETTGRRILKFGSNIGYEVVLCKSGSGLLMNSGWPWIYMTRVRTRIFFSFATIFANLIFFVPFSLL